MLGEVLEPQGEILVPLRFDSTGRSGPMTEIVDAVLHADGTNYVARGRLQVEVIPDFEYEPRTVQFGRLHPGQRATETVVFRPRALPDLTLTPTQTWRGPFEVQIRDLQATVTFHAPEVTHSETYSDILHVFTSSPRAPMVMLSLSGQVIPEVEVSPSVLVISSGKPGGVSRLTVRSSEPSRVIRLFKVSGDSREPLPLVPAAPVSLSEWALAHALTVTNAAVADANRLEFTVHIKSGAGRSEARPVFVDIKRLGQPKPETKP